MNTLLVGLVIISLSKCDRLDKKYAPARAAEAGGSGNILSPPFIDSGTFGSSGGVYRGNYNQGGNIQSVAGYQSAHVPVVSQINQPNRGDGSYSWSYESGNGIEANEKGYVKNFGAGEPYEIQTVEGSYGYTAPDGTPIRVVYTADENGFRPQGDHIPTPPPIPDEILRALEKNAADEAAGIFDDGMYRGDGYAEDGNKTSFASSFGGLGPELSVEPPELGIRGDQVVRQG